MKILPFQDASFVNKLRMIIIGTTLVALLVFAAIIIAYEGVTFRRSTITHLSAVAEIISASAAPALFFDDQVYGKKVLQTLVREQYIETAALFRADGSLFAVYYRDPPQESIPPPARRSKGYYFTSDHVEIFSAILYEGQELGTVCIQYALYEMDARFRQYFYIILGVLCASFLVAFLIASKMQKMITGPILHLAGIASTVTREKDYSVRAETGWAQDEVGRLALDFNQMLAGIEERDRNLEHLVDERTKRLQEALERLRKLDAMKTDFFTTVSHELRTPLTSILGFTKIINKRVTEKIIPRIGHSDALLRKPMESIRQDLAIILLEGERLMTMINNVLDLTKMEEGAVIWKEEPVIPAEIIEHSVTALQPLAREKGLALLTDIEDPLSTVLGDRDRLTQVMINLLGNAVKFTGSGSVTCRVRRNHREMVISVIDTGKGISEREHEKLFEKYRRGTDVDQGEHIRGAGLGLSICKYIVEHHKGRLWVESALGKGSTFSFTIPIHGH